ncbi:hypothetical protein JMK10_20635 [Rhodovulum sulfidophilum]|uniref:hypothetical protein n=1 Tax=Rhodovulum sulfidophilum TaxID=35806 RepID=UPI0019205C89|nr:hypothetical protein [Rhodovulum sulfidophilum]MBL3576324.1 hypothetical protein [Rhodovulum sulfidophilum]MCE8433721.1 hypothetical protein [Rhodovulum sulfidophilum]MCF4119094.1 hypothetical protein [Rhodovulum sulfidophilum]
MVSKHLKSILFLAFALTALTSNFINMPVSGEGNSMSSSHNKAGLKFYFGRIIIDIKAADGAVPRVDVETVGPYEELALEDEFFRGRKNANGQLVYLETWERDPEGQVGLDTLIDDKPLGEYHIALSQGEFTSQVPRFFMLSGTEWQEVSPGETEGETRFIRLRLLPAFAGEPAEPYAEILNQRLERKTYYSYDATGALTEITLQERSTGFESQAIPLIR